MFSALYKLANRFNTLPLHWKGLILGQATIMSVMMGIRARTVYLQSDARIKQEGKERDALIQSRRVDKRILD